MYIGQKTISLINNARESWSATCLQFQLDPYFSPCTKNQFKMDQRL